MNGEKIAYNKVLRSDCNSAGLHFQGHWNMEDKEILAEKST